MRSRFKSLLLPLLTNPVAARVYTRLNRGHACIFMLHRFTNAGLAGRDSVDFLRSTLAYLRRQKIPIITLGELCDLRGDSPPERAVVFTIDDGYRDFAELAAPVFEAFDAPCTVFLTTGFLDQKLWQWWDRVELAFVESPKRSLELRVGERPLRLAWHDEAAARRSAAELVGALKFVPDQERVGIVTDLGRWLDVDVPKRAPPEFAAMSWGDARYWSERGVEFGPHTVHHPILSRVTADSSRAEIEESLDRCTEELGSRPRVFCYPDGTEASFSSREVDIVAALGFDGAVTASPGYVTMRERADGAANEHLTLPRLAFPRTHPELVQLVSGLERLKMLVRRG